MDLLTHVFLPLIALYSIYEARKEYFLLSIFAVFPDFDVFLGVHRGLFHSFVFLLPFSAFLILSEHVISSRIKYSLIAVFFLLSHLFLDFLSGGVPFLYPLVDKGVGVEFNLVIDFGKSMAIREFLPKLVYMTPEPVYGKSFNAFSNFGIATMVFFVFIWYLKSRRS